MNKVRILVIEDNPIEREGIGVILRTEGYEVVLAEDGVKALDYLHHNPAPDIITLDMVLPVLDGWEILKKMDRLTLNPKPCIIVITGTLAIGQDWVADHGCTGFVRKPIKVDHLMKEIHCCLAKRDA